jgi:hypothetical protein
MIFKGADNTHLTVYAAGPVSSATTGCNNPATNTAGAPGIWTAALTRQPAASPYDWTLTIPGLNSAAGLDDFYATVRRGAAFRARCPAGTSPHKMRVTWDYTATGDANDTTGAPPQQTPDPSDPCP